uniref:Uncharacterized protein n=1 Tax=Fagus sylvatica TaxID=28930 RepID=A0A2N9EXY6_FAGSY
MTKINFIYLPHEICAAAKAAATEATAKAIIPSNIPTQTKPVVKPTIPLRARLRYQPTQSWEIPDLLLKPPYHHHSRLRCTTGLDLIVHVAGLNLVVHQHHSRPQRRQPLAPMALILHPCVAAPPPSRAHLVGSSVGALR